MNISLLGRIRHFTHVYLCTKKELYRELLAARRYGSRVDGQLAKSKSTTRRLIDESQMYYEDLKKERFRNSDLVVQNNHLKKRLASQETLPIEVQIAI